MNDFSKFKLHLSYDGTHFSGWQTQPNAMSIQTLVENSLSTALHTRTPVIGSGRTDAGVHALEQVAHFEAVPAFNPTTLIRSLNGLLPDAICVTQLQEVSKDFHARYSAKGKIYHYYFDCHLAPDPFTRLYTTHFPYPLNRSLLKEAASYFIGMHNFTSFSNEADRGSAGKNPVRMLRRLDIIEEGNNIRFEFEGDGFLYKMVRNITGTIMDIARGKIAIEALPAIFEAKNRSMAGTCAPAKGLFLIKVFY